MNKLELERKNNRLLYRELFLKGHEGFKKQIDDIKSVSFCKNLKICCKIRYTDLSPSQIYELKIQDDEVSKEYINLFLPYGSKNDFDYAVNNDIDINLNNDLARKVNEDYVDLILSKTNDPVYFYYCKHLDSANNCILAEQPGSLCSNFPHSVTTILPKECGYREWQKQAVDKIKNQISKDIFNKIKEIDNYRSTFSCKKTGTCCRLACSEFSYDELKEKAENGDNFAQQFTSIFIPYENVEEAKKVFPEYVELVQETLDEDEKVNFYYCPHLSEDNLCTRYEERPQICRDFPNNPLSILPFCCGFYDWKEEVNVAAMLLYALIKISDHTLEKLEGLLCE